MGTLLRGAINGGANELAESEGDDEIGLGGGGGLQRPNDEIATEEKGRIHCTKFYASLFCPSLFVLVTGKGGRRRTLASCFSALIHFCQSSPETPQDTTPCSPASLPLLFVCRRPKLDSFKMFRLSFAALFASHFQTPFNPATFSSHFL